MNGLWLLLVGRIALALAIVALVVLVLIVFLGGK